MIPIVRPAFAPFQYIPFQYFLNGPKKVLTDEQIKYIEDTILAPYVDKLNKTAISGSIPSIDKKYIREQILAALPEIISSTAAKEQIKEQCNEINAKLKEELKELKVQLEELTKLNIGPRLEQIETALTTEIRQLKELIQNKPDMAPIRQELDEIRVLIQSKMSTPEIEKRLEQIKTELSGIIMQRFKENLQIIKAKLEESFEKLSANNKKNYKN